MFSSRLALLLGSCCCAFALPCSALNATALRLITFDLFAALADTATSLTLAVEVAIPGIATTTASNIVSNWISTYGSYAGHVFGNASTTGGLEPFPYVNRLALSGALNGNGYSTVTPGSATFEYLATAWGNLTFWPETAETLSQLSSAGYLLAPLSNGDVPTLINATSALLPGAPMYGYFSSSRPIGAFKPASQMYAQVIVVRLLVYARIRMHHPTP